VARQATTAEASNRGCSLWSDLVGGGTSNGSASAPRANNVMSVIARRTMSGSFFLTGKHSVNSPPACCLRQLTVSLQREAFRGMIRHMKARDRARSPLHLVVPAYLRELHDDGQHDDDVASDRVFR